MAAASRPPPAALTAEPSPAEWVSRPPRVLGATCRHAGAEGAAEASQQLRLLLATRARLVADSPDMASSPDGIRSPTAAVALQGAALPRLSPLARMGASLRQQRVLDSAKYKARAELQHRRAVETCKQISRSSALGRCLEQVKTGSEEWELNRAETRRALFQRQAAFFESIDSKMIDKLEGEGDCDGGSKVGLDTATDTSGLSAVAADVDARLSLDATTEAPVEVGEEQREDKDKGRGTHSSDSSLLNYFPSDSMRGYASALNSIHTSVTAKHEERMQAAKFAREQQVGACAVAFICNCHTIDVFYRGTAAENVGMGV
jgi:hypothetical protein